MKPPENTRNGCEGGCPNCGGPAPATEAGPAGGRMVAWAFGVFLLPLFAAAAGAAAAGPGAGRQALGALAGGLAGVGFVKGLYAMTHRRRNSAA